MSEFVLTERAGAVGVIKLNRPEVLNAWNTEMRSQLITAFETMEKMADIRAVILTGVGDRAFGAGQDLNQTKTFDADRAEEWIGEWERLYDAIRSLSKPVVAALNGVAAGSAFQVALLCDIRIGHTKVTMGQPEINAGLPSSTGPWIMREMIGLARTIDLTLTGRMMDAEECHRIGVINRIVPQDKVMEEALALADLLAAKPPLTMKLNRQRFREMTNAGFRDCLEAGVRLNREAYASGEPARMMEKFLARKKAVKSS